MLRAGVGLERRSVCRALIPGRGWAGPRLLWPHPGELGPRPREDPQQRCPCRGGAEGANAETPGSCLRTCGSPAICPRPPSRLALPPDRSRLLPGVSRSRPHGPALGLPLCLPPSHSMGSSSHTVSPQSPLPRHRGPMPAFCGCWGGPRRCPPDWALGCPGTGSDIAVGVPALEGACWAGEPAPLSTAGRPSRCGGPRAISRRPDATGKPDLPEVGELVRPDSLRTRAWAFLCLWTRAETSALAVPWGPGLRTGTSPSALPGPGLQTCSLL